MSLSASLRTLLERAAFGRTNPVGSIPATIYAAAFVGSTEQASNGWARVAVANDTTSFPAASPLVTGIEILFPVVSALTNGVDSVRFYDALTSGNEVGRSETFTSVNVPSGGRLRIPVGGLTVSVP